MTKIMFFDLNIIGIGRYPLEIAKEIDKMEKGVFFYFLFEEDPDNKIDEIKKQLPQNSELIKIKNANYEYIKKIFLEIKPDSFLVMAQRIPDSALIAIANELNIRTFKFQHGLYIPYMKRNISMFFSKIIKTIRYMEYALVISIAVKKNRMEVIKNYLNIFIRGKKLVNTNLPLEKINAKTVFVYGEYWKKYHTDEFGYTYEQQIIVGYPDLIQLMEIKKKPQEDAICYICQTLVEDGRMPREQMEQFSKILAKNIGDKKLYIKLHPRSDVSLYQSFENMPNVTFLKTGFPCCTKYIGHYSSLLAMAMYLTNEVFLWKFKDHNEYPFYLVNNGKIFSDDENYLNLFIKNNTIDISFNEELKQYFYYDGISPIVKIANILYGDVVKDLSE